MAYVTIPDADINPDKPIKSATGYALRDNPLAIAAGDTGAPRVQTKAISPGGSSVDGALTNATSLGATPGFFEFSGFTRTTDLTVPCCSIIRVKGNLTLSAILTVSTVSSAAFDAACRYLGAQFGNAATGNNRNHGGGSVGAGSIAVTSGGFAAGAATALDFANLYRWWARTLPWIGGRGSKIAGSNQYVSNPGGGIVLIVDGTVDLTGGTIRANGESGVADGSERQGSGGGGSILLISTGNQLAGTLEAKGGNGGDSGGDQHGAGGGGLIARIASSFSGTRVATVTGGASSGPVSAGGNGYSTEQTLTEGEINSFLLR